MKIKSALTRALRKKNEASKRRTRQWDFFLYVAGHNVKTRTALSNLKRLCEIQLKGKYHITVIDLLKHPRVARERQIFALPTVVRASPLPVKNIIGDLSNTEKLLNGLGLMNNRAVQRM